MGRTFATARLGDPVSTGRTPRAAFADQVTVGMTFRPLDGPGEPITVTDVRTDVRTDGEYRCFVGRDEAGEVATACLAAIRPVIVLADPPAPTDD